MSKLQEVLNQLDVKNDNHWTADGLPRLDTVKMLAGDQTLTRDAVTQASPGFTRASASQGAAPASASVVSPSPADAGSSDSEKVALAAAQGAQITEPGTPQAPVAPLPYAGPKAQLPQKRDVDPEEVEALNDELMDLQGRIGECETAQTEIKKEIERCYKRSNEISDRLRVIDPPESTMGTIQAYLKSQRDLLAERGERAKALKASGINLKDLIPQKAPIDQAMSRKTARGTARPVHPSR